MTPPSCPTCGAPLKPDDRFCRACGTPITMPVDPAPVGDEAAPDAAAEEAAPTAGDDAAVAVPGDEVAAGDDAVAADDAVTEVAAAEAAVPAAGEGTPEAAPADEAVPAAGEGTPEAAPADEAVPAPGDGTEAADDAVPAPEGEPEVSPSADGEADPDVPPAVDDEQNEAVEQTAIDVPPTAAATADDAPPLGTPPEPTAPVGSRRRRRIAVGLAVLGALVAVAVAGSVARALIGGGSGAKSPEAAARRLVDAAGKEDPAAAIAVLAPDEVTGLDAVWDVLARRLADSGLAPKGDTLKGLDARVENLELDARELGSGVARVTVRRGTLAYTVDHSRLSDRAKAAVPADAVRDGSLDLSKARFDVTGSEEVELSVITVRRDGRWFVSPLLTFGDYVTRLADAPEGDFGSGSRRADAPASKDPEAALEGLVEAIGGYDVDAVAAALTPAAGAAVTTFGDAIDDLVKDAEVELDVDVHDVRVTTSRLPKGRTRVAIDGFDGTIRATSSDGEVDSVDFDFDGRCVDMRSSDDNSQSCIPRRFSEVTGIQSPFVVMAKEDGGYRLDPVATLTQWAKEALAKVDEAVVLSVLGVPQAGPSIGDVAVPSMTKGRLNEGGSAVYTLRTTGRTDVGLTALTAAEDHSLTIGVFDAKGAQVLNIHEGEYCSPCAMTLPEAGEYRVAVRSTSIRPADFMLGVSKIEPKPLKVPGEVKGDVALDRVAVFDLEAAAQSKYTVDSFGTSGVHWEFAGGDGSSVCGNSYATACRLSGKRLYVFHNGLTDAPLPFTLAIKEAPKFGFEGGQSSVSGTLVGNEQHRKSLFLEQGVTATIRVTPRDTTDVVLQVLGPNGQVLGTSDSGYGGAQESVRIRPPSTGAYTVVVHRYSSFFSSGSGSYTITVEAVT